MSKHKWTVHDLQDFEDKHYTLTNGEEFIYADNKEILKKVCDFLNEGRFIKPTSEDLINMAILVSEDDGNVSEQELTNIGATCQIVVDRLYENGDIKIPSLQEIKDEQESNPNG